MGTWIWNFNLDDEVWVKYGKDKYQAAYVSFIKLNSRRDGGRTEIGLRTFYESCEMPTVEYYDDSNQFFMNANARDISMMVEVKIKKAEAGDFDT